MKYQVRDREQNGNSNNPGPDAFEVNEFRILRERTRSKMVTGTVAVWLVVVILNAIAAFRGTASSQLFQVLNVVTPFVSLAFGWYLGREQSQ